MKSQQTESPRKPVRSPEPSTSQKVLIWLKPLIDQIDLGISRLKKHAPFWARQVKQDIRRDSKQALLSIRRVGQARVYRLKGYTTVAKINRKRQSERQQRFLRRVLFVLFAILLAILLANVYNPVKDLSEWYRIIGIKHLSDAITIPTSLPTA